MKCKAAIVSLLALSALSVPALAAPPEGTYLVEYNSGLNGPYRISWEASGSLLIADTNNHRIVRRSPNGTLTRVAGQDEYGVERQGFSGDGGPATDAQLRYPRGVAALPDGGFLIADSDNHRIRRVFPDGTIRTVAGGGYNSDGCGAQRAFLGWPTSVEPAPDGGFLINDSFYGRIRRVWPDGSITTVAGNNSAPVDSEGGPATDIDLRWPTDVSFTQDGGFLISEELYNRVLGVSPGGTITRVAGTGRRISELSGDGGPATAAGLRLPQGVAATRDGGFVIADSYNNRLRAVSPGGIIDSISAGGFDVALAPSGGAAFSIPGNNTIKFIASDLRPARPAATPGSYRGTGGYSGACLGFDPRFGGGSVRNPDMGEPVRGMVAQAQNRIVVGDLGAHLVRYSPDGTVDRSFAENGVAQAPFTWVYARQLKEQPGGGLVVAASVSLSGEKIQAAVIRFTAEGALDGSFGTGAVPGAALLPAGTSVDAMDVAADGRILIAGEGLADGTRFTRLTRDGTLDASFGSGGSCHPADTHRAPTRDVAALPDGHFLELNSGFLNPPGANTVAVSSFTASCAVDQGYGSGGNTQIVGPTRASYSGSAIELQPNGRALVAGQAGNQDNPDLGGALVARLGADGSLDRSFSGDGMVVVPAHNTRWFHSGVTAAAAIALQPDGRIVVAGQEEHPNSEFQQAMSVFRLGPDGRLDPAFGEGGRVRTPFEYGRGATGVAVRPDGGIVASSSSYYQLTLAAYRGTTGEPPPGSVTGATDPAGTPTVSPRSSGQAGAAGAAKGAAGSSQICSKVGCKSGIEVDIAAIPDALPAAHSVTVCLERRCRRASVKAGGVGIQNGKLHDGRARRVRIVVRDRNGHVLLRTGRSVKLRRLSPNGPECKPVCWWRALRLDVGSRILRVTDQ